MNHERKSPKRREASSDEQRLLEARADERAAKARLAEIELRIRNGELVERKVMDDHDALVGSFFRRWMLSLDRDWPARLVGLNEKEMATVIRQQARDTLHRMARMSHEPKGTP